MLLHKSGPTDDSRLILPRPLTSETYWILCLLHTVKAVLPALFRLYAVVAFTNQPRAQQLFSAAVSPHPAECVGWLAAPVGTGISLQRSAHSTFAICRPADYLPLELWLTSLRCKEGPYAVVVETQDRVTPHSTQQCTQIPGPREDDFNGQDSRLSAVDQAI